MKNALWKFDENLDNQISQVELYKFLDSNMKDGKEFDRALASKMFAIFDSDKNGTISIDEFIKTFITVEEELKFHISQLKAKYHAELDKYTDLKKKASIYKGEKLNNEGVTISAKLTVEISTVEIQENISQANKIAIRVSQGSTVFTTKQIQVNSTSVNISEVFEFKPTNKENLMFEILDILETNNQSLIGSVVFEINNIEKQEEYDVTFDIMDEENISINASIYSKILFIWSQFKYYDDQYIKSFELARNYKEVLDKSLYYLDILNDSFSTSKLSNDNSVNVKESFDNYKNTNTKKNAVSVNKDTDLPVNKYKEDTGDILIGDTPQANIVHNLGLIRLCFYFILLVSLINSIVFSDLLTVDFLFR